MAQSKQEVLILSGLKCHHENEILNAEGLFNIKHISDPATLEKMQDEEYNQAVAILSDHLFKLDKKFLDRMPRLKVVIRMGVGFDNVDIKCAGSMGIAVLNVPDYGTEEVADSGVCLILNLYRQTFNLACRMRDGQVMGQQQIFEFAPSARRIRDKKLGLIGLGKIGLSLANKCRALGFIVQYFDPYIDAKRASEYKTQFDLTQSTKLPELLGESDCIVTLCPLTEETKHMINTERIKLMKDRAFIVNVSRGGLVDENALAVALKSGKIAGAALDVHECEPFVFANSPLKECDNIICTPHSAFYSQESVYELATKGCIQISLGLKGNTIDKLQNCVNSKYLCSEEVNKRWK
ncbi:C-terminal-binding protein-like isoform X3 [Oopsacas minuta]|uniref:C-terminal-binding protein-like isoform X3 n=1 Tax=Oopsacas minuta TaxID=111878 RepID=A0AAV7JPC2_9METZ|nr:C-terminal-binding protein-like isoform X3 [Oopsacas minuta]